MAYIPGMYESTLIHFATQDFDGLHIPTRPSKEGEVHSMLVTPASLNIPWQLGHPSLVNSVVVCTIPQSMHALSDMIYDSGLEVCM